MRSIVTIIVAYRKRNSLLYICHKILYLMNLSIRSWSFSFNFFYRKSVIQHNINVLELFQKFDSYEKYFSSL